MLRHRPLCALGPKGGTNHRREQGIFTRGETNRRREQGIFTRGGAIAEGNRAYSIHLVELLRTIQISVRTCVYACWWCVARGDVRSGNI
eukprot:334480-Pyramimonas_sp.AAC.1